MKIKNVLSGMNRLTSSSKIKDSGEGQSQDTTDSESSDGISLSEQTSFIQILKDVAKGEEPVSADLIEQAKIDIANGSLGSKEDYEQTINALLREL
jgi:anti-sigma28 factor (negative regulator of flagellin synthesis)